MPRRVELDTGLTLQQERFVQRFFIHGNASLAYSEAYPNCTMTGNNLGAEAWKLLHKVPLQAYLATLRASTESELLYTKGQYLRECHDAFLLARSLQDPKGMVMAATAKAKAEGLIIEKRDVTTRTVREATDDDLDGEIAGIEADLAKARPAGVEKGKAPPPAGRAGPGRAANKPPSLH